MDNVPICTMHYSQTKYYRNLHSFQLKHQLQTRNLISSLMLAYVKKNCFEKISWFSISMNDLKTIYIRL